MDIIVTAHCLDRFLERFRLYFALEQHRKGYYGVILKHIRAGRVCTAWEAVPFYKNMVESKYGPTIVIYQKPCYYICHRTGDRLIVATVVKQWFCEPSIK
jgi:hypothetical protein